MQPAARRHTGGAALRWIAEQPGELFRHGAGLLPGLEIVNVGLSLFSALFLGVLYPWKMRAGE